MQAPKYFWEDIKPGEVLERRAREFQHTPQIGRTHGIHAEPITFGLKVANWFAENRRNLERAVFTLEGTLGDNWSWNTYYEHSTVRYWAHILGDAIVANLNNAEDAVSVTSANVGTSGLPLGSIACRSTLTGTAFVQAGVTAQSGCIPLDVFGLGVASA